ncbi:membrane protein [Gemmobacter tilapiae]|uniref:Membrane protein n=2 Tax=Neogemmobacter tilapiae TaxID=875041 RepID=A0A918TED8_9RHOB|nr:membrane protein [Gemmobacter tilapiae]
MMDPYLTAKWLHILSSTVLFGTGMGTAFQMVWAMRTGRVETIHSVASGVVVADWIFTAPAGLIQPLTGLWLAHLAGWPLTAPWLLLTYALYLLALACWLPVVHLQIRIRNLAGEALTKGQPLPDQARRLYRIWFALGWPAFAALVGVFWLMVSKPDFVF